MVKIITNTSLAQRHIRHRSLGRQTATGIELVSRDRMVVLQCGDDSDDNNTIVWDAAFPDRFLNFKRPEKSIERIPLLMYAT